jgi:hypothetical protein
MPVIPATQEVEIGKIEVQGQPMQKVSETPPISMNKPGVVHICNPNYVGGIGGSGSRPILGKKKKCKPLPEKELKQKRAVGWLKW